MIARNNLIKKLLGLAIFQSAVFLMYITMDKVEGGTAPIIQKGVSDPIFSNPLPQVLILTAIVVGVSTTALGLAIVVRIREAYGTIEEDEIRTQDRCNREPGRTTGRAADSSAAADRSVAHAAATARAGMDRCHRRQPDGICYRHS